MVSGMFPDTGNANILPVEKACISREVKCTRNKYINVTFAKLVLFEQERLMTKLNGQNELTENQKETIEVTNDFKVYDETFLLCRDLIIK